MTHQLIYGNCLDVLPTLPRFRCIVADPPDNIGLSYCGFRDHLPEDEYFDYLFRWVALFLESADIVWFSFNAKWTLAMGSIAARVMSGTEFTCKPCVQAFTFGQYNPHDLGNNHRPLWRFRREGAPLYPEAIKVPSWRMENGDKRAKAGGRVPGDVFDFPRVTGNSKQRRAWHPTQLNEGLVERCVLLSTVEGDRVCDPFAGTGTTLRVCKRINRPCTLIDISKDYVERIRAEHSLDLPTREKAA